VRHVRHLLVDERSRAALDVAERLLAGVLNGAQGEDGIDIGLS
jgi:hypothetical protein